MSYLTYYNELLWDCCRALFQWLLVWMLSWRSGQFLTSFSVKTESCPSHELFFPPVLTLKYKVKSMSWMNVYVRWAYRRGCSWWNVPTALLCTSSVWRCQHSWVCVISGAVDNSETLSSHSLLSSQVPLKQSLSGDSLGRCLTTNDVWSSSVLYKVREQSSLILLE